MTILARTATAPGPARSAAAHRRPERAADPVASFRRLLMESMPSPPTDPPSTIAALLDETGNSDDALRAAALLVRTRPVADIRRALLVARESPRLADRSLERLLSLARTRYAESAPGPRRAWTALSVFRGSFTRGEALDVLDACGVTRPEDALGDLVVAGIVGRRDDTGTLFRLPAPHRIAARAVLADDPELRGRAERALLTWWSEQARALGRENDGAILRDATGWDECLGDLAELLHSDHDLDLVVEIVSLLLPLWVLTARIDVAEDLLERALRSPELTPRRRFDALFTLAYITTDAERGERAVAEAARLGVDDPEARRQLLRVRGVLAVHRGEGASAVRDLGAAMALRAGDETNADVVADLSLLAAAHSLEGDQVSAQRICERAIMLCERQRDELQRGYVLWTFALAAWRAGETDRAYGLAADGAETAARIGNPFTGAACLEILAWHDAAAGRASRAARLLGAADGLRALTRSRVLHWGAAAQTAAAVREAVRTLGESAFFALFRDARGTTLDVAVSWMREPEMTCDEPEPLESLTRRQRQIVDLIADGQTNKEIAHRLAISVNTVEKHVRHVFDRLGMASRAQVAAWHARGPATAPAAPRHG